MMNIINNIPTEILLDIVTRLPNESILGCKLICKPWKNLVCNHPSFSRLHLAHLNRSADPGKLTFLFNAGNQQLKYFEYNESNDQAPIHSTSRMNLIPLFTSRCKLIGSLNGLVCLYGERDYTSCICNPVTREYVMLPKFKRDCDDQYRYLSSGFGYVPSTNEYKVIEIYKLSRQVDYIEAAVYTLGSGKEWRSVGIVDITYCGIYDEVCVFVNGLLHWMDRKEQGKVLTFNLIAEKFEYLSPPPLPPRGMSFNMWTGFALGVFGGVLCCTVGYYCDVVESDCFELWIQAEHEPLGWRKELSLSGRKPLAFTKNGCVLCFDWVSLGIYNATTSTLTKLVDFSIVPRIFPHMNTLVSLKDLGEEDIKVMEAAVTEETECL